MSRLSNRTSWGVLFCCFVLVCLMPVSGWAANKCKVCELDLSDFVNTRYTIITKQRETIAVCSFYCAAMVLKNNKFKKIMTVDYASGKKIDAKRAVYVIGSAVNEITHNKSWLVFGHKKLAETFIYRNGGILRNFKKALKSMSSRLDNKTAIPKLMKSKQTPGCLKCHGG